MGPEGGERRFRSESVEATEALGEALGAHLGPGAVVALIGELGSGKTAFVRGLARGLGVKEPVTSPTFTLLAEYPGAPVPLHHFDAWRSGPEVRFLAEGGAELLGGEGVAAVEWADRIAAWLPRPRLEVRLEHAGPSTRILSLRRVPGPGEAEGGPTPPDDPLGRAMAALTARLGLAELPPAAPPAEGNRPPPEPPAPRRVREEP
ncbi:MAG: tRNA (adenosine(37)-N6)-threonylcarbamoyltransferase complex ATPase subunit type 1 TsaE [Planctomycetota bacterium]